MAGVLAASFPCPLPAQFPASSLPSSLPAPCLLPASSLPSPCPAHCQLPASFLPARCQLPSLSLPSSLPAPWESSNTSSMKCGSPSCPHSRQKTPGSRFLPPLSSLCGHRRSKSGDGRSLTPFLLPRLYKCWHCFLSPLHTGLPGLTSTCQHSHHI